MEEMNNTNNSIILKERKLVQELPEIRNPFLANVKWKQQMNVIFYEDEEIQTQKEMFELGRFRRDNSWKNPNRYDGNKSLVNYLDDNDKKDVKAACEWIEYCAIVKKMKNENYTNFVLDNKQKDLDMQKKRRMERSILQIDSNQDLIANIKNTNDSYKRELYEIENISR